MDTFVNEGICQIPLVRKLPRGAKGTRLASRARP